MARTSGALLEPVLSPVLFEGGALFAATQQVPAGPQQQAAAADRGERFAQGWSSVAGMTGEAVLQSWACCPPPPGVVTA